MGYYIISITLFMESTEMGMLGLWATRVSFVYSVKKNRVYYVLNNDFKILQNISFDKNRFVNHFINQRCRLKRIIIIHHTTLNGKLLHRDHRRKCAFALTFCTDCYKTAAFV